MRVTDAFVRWRLVYGGNPLLAARLAAHMTVNLMDAADIVPNGVAPTDPEAKRRRGSSVASVQFAGGAVTPSFPWDQGILLSMPNTGVLGSGNQNATAARDFNT